MGRSWKKDELRLKSNPDLHKLWYVLLKERNMLLTMAAAYEQEYTAMPNPERIDKVLHILTYYIGFSQIGICIDVDNREKE